MRINAIQGSSNVYARQNTKMLSQNRRNMAVTTPETQPQNVNFQGIKGPMAVVGGILGGLFIGGPIGAIIGAAAGFQGGAMADAEMEIEEANKKRAAEEEEAKKNNKNKRR